MPQPTSFPRPFLSGAGRFSAWGLAACLLLLALTSCGQTTTLSNVGVSAPEISPNGDGKNDALTISYTIGQRSHVRIYVEDGRGKQYMLRDNELRVPTAQP